MQKQLFWAFKCIIMIINHKKHSKVVALLHSHIWAFLLPPNSQKQLGPHFHTYECGGTASLFYMHNMYIHICKIYVFVGKTQTLQSKWAAPTKSERWSHGDQVILFLCREIEPMKINPISLKEKKTCSLVLKGNILSYIWIVF